LQEFSEVLERVCETPAIFPIYDDPVRRSLLRRFPYGIFYEMETDRVVVLAFGHMKREPGAWQKRDAP
jgi:toxin ParE1/3/4